MKYELVDIDKLRPLEKVFPTHLKNLEEMIESDGYISTPIIADAKTGTIMDGSHRYAYFLKKGYRKVPVTWADYDDENIRVGRHLCHRFQIDSTTGISKDECRERALNGNLFQPRTTRHFFTFRKNSITVPLDTLKKGKPIDISYLIADVDVSDEIEHNKKFIDELNLEVETIVTYLEEVSKTKRYLLKQVEAMDNLREVAFFPGKFHPPHMGQIQTILSIIPKYREVIIGVSEHMPDKGAMMSPEEILCVMRNLFGSFPNVRTVLIEGVLVERKDVKGLPKFDVLLSGNPEVLEWCNKHGIKHKHIARSFSISGTDVRSKLSE